MKNYVQPGNTITLTAPDTVASGDGLIVGSIFGVAAIGESVETALVGVAVEAVATGAGDTIGRVRLNAAF